MAILKKNSKLSRARFELAKDVFFILIGAGLAVMLSRTGAIDAFISLFGNVAIVSFFAGIFFTSVFTIAPSSVALAHIAGTGSFPTIAFWGALGAMFGDLVLFYFLRDHFADDLVNSFRPTFVKKVLRTFHFGFMRWLAPIIGAAIIASPLPDEFGIMLMGLSRVRAAIFIPVAFIMNVAGIYLIISVAKIVSI